LLRFLDIRKHGDIAAKSLIIRRVNGLQSSRAKTLCVFASFDEQSVVDDYVLFYLSELRRQLAADIVFVTTSERLDDADIERLKPFCKTIVHRKNVTIDFGSWKVGLEETPDWDQYENLIIANDSVYGPLSDLTQIFSLLDPTRPTMVGITESLQRHPHLQSYFLLFNRPAIQSEFFRSFWDDFKFYESKKLIILDYEIGISRKAEEHGVLIKSFFPYKQLEQKSLQSEAKSYLAHLVRKGVLNPTHHFWRALLLEKNSLFIKIELLKKNPTKMPDLEMLESDLKLHPTYRYSLIENHLKRVMSRSRATR
jgi:lipopolysaccharide biosynthesis protein